MAILALFICTQFPTTSYAIYRLILPPNVVTECGSTLRFLSTSADALTVLNSAVNFLIYYPSATTFRKTLNKLWTPSSTSSIKTLRKQSRSTSARSSLNTMNKLNITRPNRRAGSGDSLEPPLSILLTVPVKYASHEL